MNVKHGRVVVGVDGTQNTLRAVRYAALAATAAGADLEVVHVVPLRLPVGPVRPVEPPEFEDLAQSIVQDAAVLARVTVPGLTVHTRLMHGPTVRALVAASSEADLVVMGAQHEGTLAHVWTGRVSIGVAARAACPSVVVPPEWEPGHERGRVVVGFKHPDGSLQQLTDAFAEADRRGADLRIVHAWKLPSAYDDVIGARIAEESYRTHTRETIEPLIADLREAHPGVHVMIEVQHAQPARALVDASHDADLVVLTRPTAHQGVPHLGSTARAVLRWATAPVIVFPVSAEETAPDERPLTLERDGALRR
jgi:nucleotide-binding universal stress UspA family protein